PRSRPASRAPGNCRTPRARRARSYSAGPVGPIERRAIGVSGIVQGVGFRPHVHQLATRLGLSGFVRNRLGAVEIEIEGDRAALDEFARCLVVQAPALAAVDGLRSTALPVRGEAGFSIETSRAAGAGPGEVFISPDLATSDACLAELFDPRDRRHRYP